MEIVKLLDLCTVYSDISTHPKWVLQVYNKKCLQGRNCDRNTFNPTCRYVFLLFTLIECNLLLWHSANQ